jgi:hypothetical protein
VWVNAETARDAFVPAELAPSRLTSWFRERVPCPYCQALMTLRGHDMALFQGCDDHGFWIDDETVGQTGLARAAVTPQVQRAREAAKAMRIEQERREASERDARAAAERERLERENSAEAIAARRAADEAERRRQETLAWRRAPVIRLLRHLTDQHDLAPLADYLIQLEDTIEQLGQRVHVLEGMPR